jgi:hypothetical protein
MRPNTSLERTVIGQWLARRTRESHCARSARSRPRRAAAQLNR